MHRVDFWLPFKLDPNAKPMNSHYLLGVGRMKTGVAPEAVQAELQGIVARFPELFPSAYSASFMTDYQFGVSATPLRRDVLGSTERVLWIVFGAVLLVFAIAATNVANLFLVRAEVRRRDTSVRSALGAGRGQLAVQYMTESLLLALLATALGIVLATVGVKALIAFGPERLPRLDEVSVGIRSVVIAAALGVASGMTFGIFPLAGGARSLLALRDGGRGTTVSLGRRRIRRAMIVGQVTLALVLLAGAGLMVRSVMRLNAVRPGFDASGVLAIDLPLPRSRYRTYDDVVQFQRMLIERVSALPTVVSAGMGSRLPIDGMGGCAVVF
ncbi:MAG: FtsX-like permease family protein, partial [Vicinamibacterales bacterium]